MDRQLTDLVELDVDDAAKLYLLDELLNQQREALSSSELLSLFWIAILSLSVRPSLVETMSYHIYLCDSHANLALFSFPTVWWLLKICADRFSLGWLVLLRMVCCCSFCSFNLVKTIGRT